MASYPAPYPVGPPPSTSRGTSPYTSGGWNPFNQRDVYNLYQQMGQNGFQQGQDWQNNYGSLSDYYNSLGAQAGQNVNNLYNPIWGGGGGYTPEQQGNIVRSGDFSQIQGDQTNNFLNPSEQSQIQGNPYAAFDLFRGQAPALTSMASSSGMDLRNQALAGAGQGNDVVSRLGTNLDAAIDPTQLSLSSGFLPHMQGTLSAGASGLHGFENDSALNPTSEYLRQAGLSDAQVNDISEAGGRQVGAQYGATKDQIIQNAQASGEVNPLALASALTRLDNNGAANQSDAITSARLNALAQQRQAASGIQGTQLNAGQYRAGLGSQNTLAQENADIAGNTTAEQLRLAAASGLSGARVGAASTLANAGLQNEQYNTGQAINTGTQAGNWNLSQGNTNANTATTLMGNAENTNSARSQFLGTNRQGVNQANQGMNYNIGNSLSSQYQNAYAPWVSAQTEGRQAAQGQQQYYGNQANTQGQLRLGGAQTFGQQQLGAANGYSGWGQDQQQTSGFGGFVNNFAKLGQGAAGFASAATGGKALSDERLKENVVESDSSLGKALGLKTYEYNLKGSPDRERGFMAQEAVQNHPDAVQVGDDSHPWGIDYSKLKAKALKLGGIVDHPRTVEVGEHDRPEAVLPLDPQTPPGSRNVWENMGSKLGEAMGLKHHYADGGLLSLGASNPFIRAERELKDSEDYGLNDYDDKDHYALGGIISPEVLGVKRPKYGLKHFLNSLKYKVDEGAGISSMLGGRGLDHVSI